MLADAVNAEKMQFSVGVGQIAGFNISHVCAEGQNVGNFLTNRPSSRVLAAPGGISQIVFGDGARGITATKVTSRY